jgi:hypothetical protein
MERSASILAAAVIIAAAILFIFRWEISAGTTVVRIDRWTGAVSGCTALLNQADAERIGVGTPYRCTEMTAEEMKQSKVDTSIR